MDWRVERGGTAKEKGHPGGWPCVIFSPLEGGTYLNDSQTNALYLLYLDLLGLDSVGASLVLGVERAGLRKIDFAVHLYLFPYCHVQSLVVSKSLQTLEHFPVVTLPSLLILLHLSLGKSSPVFISANADPDISVTLPSPKIKLLDAFIHDFLRLSFYLLRHQPLCLISIAPPVPKQ